MNGQLNDYGDLRRYVYATVTPEPRLGDGRRYERHGPIHLFESTGGSPADNEVMVLGPANPEDVFARADTFFGEPSHYQVTVDAEAAPEVEAALRARGWHLDEEEPALVLRPLQGVEIPPPPAELLIRRVATEADLAVFRMLSRTAARWIPSLAAATAPGVALFVGSVDGVDIATSRAKVKGSAPRVVDINGVNTRPDARRRGYGTAMTWQTVRFGAALGAEAAVLTATPMGYSVYVRMGFAPVCMFRTFVPPGQAGAPEAERAGTC